MNNFDLSIFIILSIISITCALFVILSKNPIHSLLFLIATFFSISGHYIVLNAQFLAVVNIIVYSGAIMVLFLFVLMLMNLNQDTEPQKKFIVKLSGVCISGIFCLTLLFFLMKNNNNQQVNLYNSQIGLVKNLGQQLFKQFVLPFELTGLLFLTAIIGSILLARKNINHK